MAYVTRNGTKVLNGNAARLAILEEIQRNSYEYRCYRSFRSNVDGDDGDALLIRNSDHRPGDAIVLNLVTGGYGICPWEHLAHCVKPYDQAKAQDDRIAKAERDAQMAIDRLNDLTNGGYVLYQP